MKFVIIGVIVLAIAFVLVVLADSVSNDSPPIPVVRIEVQKSTNAGKFLKTSLLLSNQSTSTIIFDPFFTVYWTNMSGVETNTFLRHPQGRLVFGPNTARLIAVTVPEEAIVWDASFAYRKEKSRMKKQLEKCFWLFGIGTKIDNSFSSSLSPLVTNGGPQ